jgi:hypothetical protein
VKLCQYVATDEESENIKEKNCKNPDWLESDKSMLIAGKNPITDIAKVAENKITRLKIRRRCFLCIFLIIFSYNPIGGSKNKDSMMSIN